MANDRTILVTGVTGQQGGAMAQGLQGMGFHLRGLTRKPESERAAALAHQGIEIVKGDRFRRATLPQPHPRRAAVLGDETRRQ